QRVAWDAASEKYLALMHDVSMKEDLRLGACAGLLDIDRPLFLQLFQVEKVSKDTTHDPCLAWLQALRLPFSRQRVFRRVESILRGRDERAFCRPVFRIHRAKSAFLHLLGKSLVPIYIPLQ